MTAILHYADDRSTDYPPLCDNEAEGETCLRQTEVTCPACRGMLAAGSPPRRADEVEAAAWKVVDLWLDGTIATPSYSPANAALLTLRRTLGDRRPNGRSTDA